MNGTEYVTDGILPDDQLSEKNLKSVVVDGADAAKMVLICRYDVDGQTHFAIRYQTEAEKLADTVEQEITNSQMALAEIYEMIIGLS